MGKKSKKPSASNEQPSSEKKSDKVTLKAKANWQLRDRFVRAGETVKVDKDYAELLLKQSRNFSLV